MKHDYAKYFHKLMRVLSIQEIIKKMFPNYVNSQTLISDKNHVYNVEMKINFDHSSAPIFPAENSKYLNYCNEFVESRKVQGFSFCPEGPLIDFRSFLWPKKNNNNTASVNLRGRCKTGFEKLDSL